MYDLNWTISWTWISCQFFSIIGYILCSTIKLGCVKELSWHCEYPHKKHTGIIVCCLSMATARPTTNHHRPLTAPLPNPPRRPVVVTLSQCLVGSHAGRLSGSLLPGLFQWVLLQLCSLSVRQVRPSFILLCWSLWVQIVLVNCDNVQWLMILTRYLLIRFLTPLNSSLCADFH